MTRETINVPRQVPMSCLPIQGAGPGARGDKFFVARRLLPAILMLVVLHGSASATMYRWVDDQGEVHVTDDLNNVPEQYRPRGDQMAPAARNPAASPAPRSSGAGRQNQPQAGAVALWLRAGGIRGFQDPVLIQVYDSEEACRAERDRRMAVHARQGMQRTDQPGLAMSNPGGAVVDTSYLAYRCVPAGIRSP